MRPWIRLALGVAAFSTAAASNVVTVDVLDPWEGVPPPAGITCIDMLVDVSDGDAWTAAGIRITAHNGAALRYATDPNTQQPILTNPTTANRHVTFFSEPRPRDGNTRYNSGGAAAAGTYSPPVVLPPVASPTEVNVAFFASPPETIESPTVDGAIFRVAVDPPPIPPGVALGVLPGRDPPGMVEKYLDCETVDPLFPGIASATFDVPSLTGLDWEFGWIVPEPTSLTLLALGGFLISRRRA